MATVDNAYPFAGIVGMADLGLALLLNAVSPAIGGVLVRGEKGTAKSTMVRALAALLPELDVVVGCRFGCDPAHPDPDCPDGPHDPAGPTAHRRAALVRHAARFLLVGTMNPEEGELRPQLLDRFGLAVDVAAPRDPRSRAEVVRRRLAYDGDPHSFAAAWAPAEAALAAQIVAARSRLSTVDLPEGELHRIAAVCAAFGVDGMRADIVVARTGTALAAWHGRPVVTEADVRDAVRLALPHRRRRDPFDAPGLSEEALDQAMKDAAPPPEDPDDDPGGGAPEPAEGGPGGGGG